MMRISDDPRSKLAVAGQCPVGVEAVDAAEQQARKWERRSAREHTEALLDDALGESFPASDPISITPPEHAGK